MSNNEIKEVINEWLETRQIIADFLKELNPTMSEEEHLHNAAALIARLAQANIVTGKYNESSNNQN